MEDGNGDSDATPQQPYVGGESTQTVMLPPPTNYYTGKEKARKKPHKAWTPRKTSKPRKSKETRHSNRKTLWIVLAVIVAVALVAAAGIGGYYAGNNTGYSTGYDAGNTDGYDTGYAEAKDEWYETGVQTGTQNGLKTASELDDMEQGTYPLTVAYKDCRDKTDPDKDERLTFYTTALSDSYYNEALYADVDTSGELYSCIVEKTDLPDGIQTQLETESSGSEVSDVGYYSGGVVEWDTEDGLLDLSITMTAR